MFEVFTSNTMTAKQAENNNHNLQRTFGTCIESKKYVYICIN